MAKTGSSKQKSAQPPVPMKVVGVEGRPMTDDEQRRWEGLITRLVEKHGPDMLEYARRKRLEKQQTNNPA